MKSLHVQFVEWYKWVITLEAKNEDDAIEKATERWNEMGADDRGFNFKKGGTDCWEAVAVRVEQDSNV